MEQAFASKRAYRKCNTLSVLFALFSALLGPSPVVASNARAYHLTGDYWGTHDPSIAKEGSTWYVFATGRAPDGGQFAVRCSSDLATWKLCGHVFDAIATNKTLDPKSPDYKWVDKGLVLRSVAADDFNAIDPNFIVDKRGRSWLAFGSFWSGIKMRRLDAEGKLSSKDTKLYPLATREKPATAAPAKPGLPPDWEAVEAPFIIEHGDYYYLFVSWDMCCRGVKSTYRTMVGRANQIIGPYVDQNGKAMMQGGGTEVLHGNRAWLGPGGESILLGKPDDLLGFHAYDTKTGKPALQISTIDWRNGWPQAALEQQHAPAR